MRRSPLIAVYLTVFIDLLGFSIILPLLPYYAERYGATGAWVGALLTAYAAMQFLSAPILGRLSDRYGRRPILLVSLAGSAAGLVLTGLAHSLWLLLLARIIDGASGGSIATAQAYIADATPPEERARYMGLLGAAVGLGFTLGPGIGGALNVFGFSTAAFAAAALSTANLCFAALKLSETRRCAGGATGALPAPREIAATLREPALGRTLWAGFLATFAFAGLEATYALFGQRYFGLTGGGFAALFTYIGVLGIVTQGFLVRRLARRFGEARLAAASAGLLALTLLVTAAARTLPTAIVVITLLALGQGLLSPMLPALLSLASSADEQGHTLGIGQALQAAARAIGPIVAGALFDLSASLPYLAGGALTLLATLLLLRVRLPARVSASSPREAVAAQSDFDP